MRGTKRVLAGVLVLAVAAPATAVAQSAGDKQYIDPFHESPATPEGDQGGGSQGGSAGGDAGSGSGVEGDPGASAPAPPVEETAPPVTEAPPSPTVTPGATTGTPAVEASPVLPRTGPAFVPVAALGLLLVVVGLALRRLA